MQRSTISPRRPGRALAAGAALLALVAGCGGSSTTAGRGEDASARRVLLVGWDGASFDTIDPLLAAGELPNVRALLERGCSARLQSTIVPISSAAWTTAVTGRGPGETGVYSFFEPQPDSYDVRLISSRSNRAAPLWRVLTARGLGANVVGVPVTWPPEAVFGTMVSGMLSPFDAVYTHPPELTEELRARGFVPDLGIWRAEQERDPRRFQAQLQLKTELVLDLLRRDDWAFTMVVFKSLDVLSHKVYVEGARGPVADWTRELDRVLGRLVAAVGPDTDVLLMSDHGFRGYPRGFNLQSWLVREGWAVRRTGDPSGALDGPLAERRAEERRRLIGELDLARTRAFATVSEGHFGSLRLNVAGREPQGVVAPDEVEALLAELEAALLAEPAVRRVLRGAELYPGPHREVVPDLLVEADPATQVVSTARGPVLVEYRGRRPDHAREGILIAAGPSILRRPERGEAEIADVAPTVLYLLDQALLAEMDGRVLRELLARDDEPRVVAAADDAALQALEREAGPVDAAGLEDVRARLRELGYVE